MIAAVPLMVNEVDILDRSIWSKRISASASVDRDTPTLPISDIAISSSGS